MMLTADRFAVAHRVWFLLNSNCKQQPRLGRNFTKRSAGGGWGQAGSASVKRRRWVSRGFRKRLVVDRADAHLSVRYENGRQTPARDKKRRRSAASIRRVSPEELQA